MPNLWSSGMKLIKQINEQVIQEEAVLTAAVAVLVENCSNLNITKKEVSTLTESAGEFLNQLAANLANGKLPKEPTDLSLRDSMTMLSVLDLLRQPQPRQAANVNTLKGYLQIVDGVSRNLAKNSIEVNVMKELDRMKSPDGKNGMDVRDEYIKMATADDVTPLIKKVSHLIGAYKEIGDKLHLMVSGNQQNQQAPARPVPNAQGVPA